MDPLLGQWQSTSNIGHFSFTCGYCGERTGVRVGFYENQQIGKIYLCGGCNRPTYIENEKEQTPAPILGDNVDHLPTDVESLYQEARKCTQVESYTACVLTCRKILMHIVVEKGAKPGQTFFHYVEYLANNGYVPPEGKGWVDHIRKKGNEANHEIVIMNRDEGFELLSFIEFLLKFIYEMPTRIMPPSPSP